MKCFKRPFLVITLIMVLSLSACSEETVSVSEADVIGTYFGEEPGFGGTFSVSIFEDGTFTYYEGALSSYFGTGKWTLDKNRLTLTDVGYGEAWDFVFTYKDGNLIFEKDLSHRFIYEELKDQAVFIPEEEWTEEELDALWERSMEKEKERATNAQKKWDLVQKNREETLSKVNKRPFLGDGFLGSLCFDASENSKDSSKPVRIWIEDSFENVLWESTMGLSEEEQSSFYYYEVADSIPYIIEYNASTKYHFEMFTINLEGEKTFDLLIDVPETTDIAGFNTEVKKYLKDAKLIIGTVEGSVSIPFDYSE